MKKFKKIIEKGNNHLSLSVIVLGAICYFLANIVLKEKLTHGEYGIYSIVITYFSMMNLYGLLGLEQVFIRLSDFHQKDKISTPKFLLKLIVSVIVISSVLGTFIFRQYCSEILNFNLILFFLATIGIVSLLFLYNILRLNSDFVLSQLFFNLWKIVLPILAILCFYWYKLDFTLFLIFLMCIIILSFVLSLYFCLKRIHFVYKEMAPSREIIKTAIQFLISITSFSFLIFGDRLIIEHKFGLEEFGNYFYLSNFFLAPFSILQNYIGFKQLIVFKRNFNLSRFDRFNKKIIFFGLCLSLILILFLKLVNCLKVLSFDFDHYNLIIMLLLILGIIRLYSSAITSAFEAKTNVNTFKKGNFIFITLSSIIVVLDIFFIHTLYLIVLSIIVIWLIRCTVFRKLLMQQLKRESNQRIKD